MPAISRAAEILELANHDDSLTFIDIVHRHIHKKNFFDYQKRFLNLADDGTIELLLKATTKQMHLIITVDAEGKSYFDSYVGGTYSDGTLQTSFNRFIDNAPAASGGIYLTPTVSTVGTVRFEKLILGGTGPQSTGASGGSRVESILDVNTELLIVITNKSGQAKDYGITIEWYEESEES